MKNPLTAPAGKNIKHYGRGCKPHPGNGPLKHYGRGCKPRPAMGLWRLIHLTLSENIKHYGRGCKPHPAMGRLNITDGVANPIRQWAA